MTDVALIDEDTLATLVVDGAESVSVDYPGQVTDHPTPDRASVSDGVIRRPRVASIRATLSPAPELEGLTRGPQRIAEVIQYLTDAQREGRTLALQQPGVAQIPAMVIESFSHVSSGADSLDLSISLKGVRYVETSTVDVGRVPEPTAAARPSIEAPEDTGAGGVSPLTGGDQSLLAAGADTLGSLLGVGP